MKKNRKNKQNRILTAILMVAMVMAFATSLPSAQTVWAAESATEVMQAETVQTGDAEQKDIVIEVVKDIPADTIEDEEVPLAATPSTATHNGMRVGIPVTLAVVIVLTWFYGRNRRARAEIRLYQER